MDTDSTDGKWAADIPVAIQGRRMLLRPVEQADIPLFFRWRAELSERHMWSYSQRLPTREEFTGEVEQMFQKTVTLLVLEKKQGAPIGFVQAYNLNPTEGWAFTLAYVIPEFRKRGHAAEAYTGLLHYLFQHWPLRKVYADIYEYNIDSMRPLMASGFVEEGRFRQHVWFKDRYWDVIRLAGYRDQWDEEGALRARLIIDVEAEAAAQIAGDGESAGLAEGSGYDSRERDA